MSTYEVEHSTTDPSNPSQTRSSRRPDLSTFFSTLSEISPDEHRSRRGAVPPPGDVSAVYYSLAEALSALRLNGGFPITANNITELQAEMAAARAAALNNPVMSEATGLPTEEHGRDLLREMVETLLQNAESPPEEVEGVSEEFCADLDRVPRSSLKPSQSCPICSNPFLDDKYPLVVRLPCHPTHLFDLECVRPWLRLRGTCPLDRTDFAKQLREKAEARKKAVEEDEEEEWDGMYG
ncbi:hypothetical protein BJX63DRAFT_178117 [Aspergillus granulosus]|uniref:RING-type domain-containing protein n=1 Tax=Aspergillus granulosus TaxID=176169 RepID=A0ABR4I4U2_9EURO